MRRVMSVTAGGAVLLLLGGCSHLQDVSVPLLYSGVVSERIISGCGEEPKVDVTPTVENERVVFAIQASHINGLLGFRVQDEGGEALWDVDLSYEKGNRITYGVLPTGGNMPARQQFPPDGAAPSDIRGKTVTITVTYQYDRDLAARSSSISKTVRIPLESNERDVSADRRQPPSPAKGVAPNRAGSEGRLESRP